MAALARETRYAERQSLLVGDRFGSANVDASVSTRLAIKAAMTTRVNVQRSRRRELGERTQSPMRQPRRARRERVEMKHDERSRKADTEGLGPRLQPTRRNRQSASPISRPSQRARCSPTCRSWGKFPEVRRNLTPRSFSRCCVQTSYAVPIGNWTMTVVPPVDGQWIAISPLCASMRTFRCRQAQARPA